LSAIYAPKSPIPSGDAARLEAGATVWAGAVAILERSDHKVSQLDLLYLFSDILNDSDKFMTDRSRRVWVQTAIEPKV
jgi:hypothetical protein